MRQNGKSIIEFEKRRDLGDMLSSTFQFLKLEGKSLFKTVFKISAFPILVFLGFTIYSLINYAEFYDAALNFTNEEEVFEKVGGFFTSSLMLVLSYLLAYVFVSASVLYYIKSYWQNRGVVNYEDVKQDVQNKFWSLLGLSILNVIIIFVGLLFCFLPGIYFGIVLSLSMSAMVFFNLSAFDSIGEAFSLIRDNFWNVFLILFVVGLIMIVVSWTIQMPMVIYQFRNLGEDLLTQGFVDYMKDPVYLGFMILSYLVRFLLYTISLIVSVFIFFDIKVKKGIA